MLLKDLSNWCLATVMVTAVKADALTKRTMFHVQIFAVAVTNFKILMYLLLLQLLMTMMKMNSLKKQTNV